MKLLRNILLPFVPIYFLVAWMRNALYDLGILISKSYDTPLICVGNLSVGGTGKTPMIEYLIRLLNSDLNVATLSRGYKRQSSGFLKADSSSTVLSIGDEPFQFFKKFDDLIVAVDESRQRGISRLISEDDPDVILLDDAFQHRQVTAGLNILLTAYNNLYVTDLCLPTGNLREPRSGSKRAEIIIVTKCPKDLSKEQQLKLIDRLNPLKTQKVFFSSIVYSEEIISNYGSRSLQSLSKEKITVVTGIANPIPFVDHLKSNGLEFEHLNFMDHHIFNEKNIEKLEQRTCILTTEKDYWRLENKLKNTALYYLPIEIDLSEGKVFNELITSYVSNQLSRR